MSKLLDALAEIFPVNALEVLDELRIRSSKIREEKESDNERSATSD